MFRRMRAVVFAFIAVVLAVMVCQAPTTFAAQQNDAVFFQTGRILKYEQLAGQSSWLSSSQARFQQAQWAFYADGTFVFAPADSRDDLYPLQGTYEFDGTIVTFRASRSSTIGQTGSAYASIGGQIDFSSDEPVITMNWTAGNGNAASIDGIGFAGANSSSYNIVATLVWWP